MAKWSLSRILSSMHDDIQGSLQSARETLQHPGTKGDASEKVWIDLLKKYLPKRYKTEKAHIVDSKGNFSEQIDVVIFDRQYSPLIFKFKDELIIPAESIYAVFETRQTVNAENMKYAQKKVASVRRLYRTSLPIPHAGGTFSKKEPARILGGILTLENGWKSDPSSLIEKHMNPKDAGSGSLDFGCIASHGYFCYEGKSEDYKFHNTDKAVAVFLFHLISRLQSKATVPMIDLQEYAKWLQPPE